jgi:cyclophilin family peptidyl-prolyl cis-trans isomerase
MLKPSCKYIFILNFFSAYLAIAQVNAQPLPEDLKFTEQSPDSFLVSFKTTKGNFVMKAHRNWSPLGADRLYILAKNGYYNGCVIYRVAPTKSYAGGFVAQFGLGNSEAVNAAWDKAGIKDEPVVQRHQRGTVCFARGGPGTRSVELAIDVAACPQLDTISYQGVVGFPVVAEVVEGMEVVDLFNRQYGNSVFDHEDSLRLGRAYLDRAYPGLDRIESVEVIKTW